MPKAKNLVPAQALDPFLLLFGRPVFEHEEQADVVADDGVLVLQIAVQAQAA